MSLKISKERIEEAIKSSNSMTLAASKVGIQFSTFKKYAEKFGIYQPNQGLKGSNKPKADGFGKISLKEILEGLHPQYHTFKLKKRLYAENLKENKCEECGINEWNGDTIQCELDHIDGDRTNHRLANLRILCPNCHSQTDTFRSKKRI